VHLPHYIRDDTADPELGYPGYFSTRLRTPHRPLRILPQWLTEVTAPAFGHERIGELDHDLTRQHGGEPIGERIIVSGRVLDTGGNPVPGALVEVWQANAAGRYAHAVDGHPAPLDPNFSGAGRCLTGPDGGYRFVTVKPGAYPWRNHPNAWRPAHIHFSLLGRCCTELLVTQMYFPGDPSSDADAVVQSVRAPSARAGLAGPYV